MATSNDATRVNPADQVTETMKVVSEALRAAGEKAAGANNQLAEFTMKQVEQNAALLLETLQKMAAAGNPAEVANLYMQFMAESTRKQTQQLAEISQIMARSSQGGLEDDIGLSAGLAPVRAGGVSS